MKKLLLCKFNMDTDRVELKYSVGSMQAIDCASVENESAKTIRQRFALDYLIYMPGCFSAAETAVGIFR